MSESDPHGSTVGPSIAVRAGHSWDPVEGAMEGPVMVVCSPADGRIVTVDHTGATAPDGVEVLDFGPAATVMPGLVDAHVHLCWDPHDDPVEQFLSQPDEVLAARAQAALEVSLRAGITTVRDLGDRRYLTLDVRTRSAGTPWLAPEIVVAGPPITPPKGHCWFLGGEALGIDAVVAAVDERAGHGVDVIKVMATGGMLTPGWGLHESQYDTATLAAAVTAARRHGLPVTTHAHGGPGIRAAVDAGVHGIEHCTFLTADDVRCDWELVDQIAAAGIHVSATEAWAPSSEPFPPAAAARIERVWENLQRMHRLGVRLSISSDAGIGPRKPHGVLPHGAVLFAGLGMTNHDALTAVTARPAAACRLGHRKARLTAGYDADLLVIDGDPVARHRHPVVAAPRRSRRTICRSRSPCRSKSPRSASRWMTGPLERHQGGFRGASPDCHQPVSDRRARLPTQPRRRPRSRIDDSRHRESSH